MKRLPGARTLLGVALTALIAAAWLAFARPVEMRVDGERIESEVPPIATIDRIFVPLRTIADAIGARLSVSERNHIRVVRAGRSLDVQVGERRATIDGAPVTLSRPPFAVRGRVMVELRAVASAFGVRTRYDARLRRLDLVTPGIGQAVEPVAAR